MIKRILLYGVAMMITGSLSGQTQSLVSGKSDFVGLSGYPTSPHLVEAGPTSFYWISGSSYSVVNHPNLSEVYNDFANIFFLKYDENGQVLSSNYIRGSNYANEAVSYKGGLTLMAQASYDVEASGNFFSLNGAFNMEIIAKYNPDGTLDNIVKVFNLVASDSQYSQAKGDKRDGSMYIYGTGNGPLEVEGHGLIGKDESQDYLYVLKYGPDLQLNWVYTAGFDTTVSANGYYMNLQVIPDINGNAVLTGTYDINCSPQFGNDVLPPFADGYGVFAVKLDRTGQQMWVREGTMKGYGYETKIFKGLAMKDGDLILAGATTTGYFKLGEVEVNFVNGSGYTNQFVFRMGPDGTVRWIRPFQNMGTNFGEGKKGAKVNNDTRGIESEVFTEQFYYDVIQWNDEVLYMCGSFLIDAFNVAGRVLEKPFSEGAFIAAIDLKSGDELWGYGLSSDFIGLQGFDADGSGNVSLMGASSENQNFEGLVAEPVAGTYPLFYVGLDYKGTPLWTNSAYIQQGPGYWLSGVDLEVLWNGEIFSSVYLAQTDSLMIGGSTLFENYPYTSWLVELQGDSEIGGMVSDASGNPVYPGSVRIYKSSRSGAYPMVDSVMIDEAGGYLFNGLNPGNYTLQAVPDQVLYPLAIPTYLGDQMDWNGAQFNDFTVNTKVNFLNINVHEIPKLTPEDGSGTVSGNLSYEEDGVLKGTMARPVKKGPVILSRRTKKSTSEDVIIAYIETDANGDYIFDNIPDGNYILIVDIPGLGMLETHEITLQGGQIVAGMDYTVGANGIYTWTGVGIHNLTPDQIKLFPNPGNGLVYMELPIQGDYLVQVYGTDGRLIVTREYSSAVGNRYLDISDENEGVYVIKIEGPSLSTAVKYVKR